MHARLLAKFINIRFVAFSTDAWTSLEAPPEHHSPHDRLSSSTIPQASGTRPVPSQRQKAATILLLREALGVAVLKHVCLSRLAHIPYHHVRRSRGDVDVERVQYAPVTPQVNHANVAVGAVGDARDVATVHVLLNQSVRDRIGGEDAVRAGVEPRPAQDGSARNIHPRDCGHFEGLLVNVSDGRAIGRIHGKVLSWLTRHRDHVEERSCAFGVAHDWCA